MNVSIKPFLILTSSPQMASLIYPFPRILAVHLKYAAANASWETVLKHQGRTGLLAFMRHTCFWTRLSHHLPSPVVRYDYNCTTGLPWKARTCHSLIWQPIFSLSVFFFLPLPVSGYSSSLQWEQKLMLQYIGTTAGEASHIQLHLQRVFIVVRKASDKLALWWHAPCCRGEAEICCLLETLIMVVASGREPALHLKLLADSFSGETFAGVTEFIQVLHLQ